MNKLIFNPVGGRKAGVALGRPSFEDVAALLSRYEIPVDASLSEYPGHATELAAEAVQRGYDAVIAAGGDGTVHEVSQPLVGTPVKLGILPLGSMMNLCRTLAIPRDPEAAVRVLRMNHVVAIDVGQVSDRYFLEAAGVGIDAGILLHSNAIDQGRWASIRDLVEFIQAYQPMPLQIRIDGRRVRLRALMALVANAPWYGAGFRIASSAKINDGALDLVVIGAIGKLDLLRHWVRSLLPGRSYLPATRLYRTREVTIEGPGDLLAHADGFALGGTSHTFRAIPAALQVYVGFPADPRESAFIEHRKPRIWLPFRRPDVRDQPSSRAY